MEAEDERFFLRGLNSDALQEKLAKFKIPVKQFIQLENNIIAALCDGVVADNQEIMAYIEWFKRKVLKNVGKSQLDTLIDKSQLNVLVKGCGKNIPNGVEKDQCFTWWFLDGNWKDSKKNEWRVGCNWG